MTTRHVKDLSYLASIEFVRGAQGLEVNTVDPETGTIGNYGYLSDAEAETAFRAWLRGKEWSR